MAVIPVLPLGEFWIGPLWSVILRWINQHPQDRLSLFNFLRGGAAKFNGGTLNMIRHLIALSFAACAMMTSASAEEFGTKDEAIAMVKRVQEMFKKDGADATFKAVSDPSTKDFHDRDLYPFIYFRDGDKKGLCVAHGARPALIGKNLLGLKDQDGKYLIQALADVANGPGSGWVDYKWPNPVNNKIEDKSSYVEKMGDYFVGVGVYR